jgi:antirestriction protein ArdC
MEELVAELGSAFLSADLDLTPEIREDHAAYIASWIKALKNDKHAIFTAASYAQRAVAFLHGAQPEAKARGTVLALRKNRAHRARHFSPD